MTTIQDDNLMTLKRTLNTLRKGEIRVVESNGFEIDAVTTDFVLRYINKANPLAPKLSNHERHERDIALANIKMLLNEIDKGRASILSSESGGNKDMNYLSITYQMSSKMKQQETVQ